MGPATRLTTFLLVTSACTLFAAPVEFGSVSKCTDELAALMVDAQEAPWGDLVAYASLSNYSQGYLATYMAFYEGPAACSAPKAVGLEISNGALYNLPGPREVNRQPPEPCFGDPFVPGCFQPHDSIFLPFFNDQLGPFNPFMVMEFDWQPYGHEPPGVYTSPHMDFHFYIISEERVMNITGGPCSHLSPDSFAAANQPMPRGCFPGGGYVNIGATTPVMGNHILDMGSPEMKARQEGGDAIAAWNQTWIWGGLDGQVVFFEAMIQRRYLQSQPEMCSPIPGMPLGFSLPGFKPHTYCILTSPGSVRVELRDFSWYDQGCENTADVAPTSFLSRPPTAPPLPPQCQYPQPQATL